MATVGGRQSVKLSPHQAKRCIQYSTVQPHASGYDTGQHTAIYRSPVTGWVQTHYDHLQFHASRIQYIDDRALTNSYLAYTRSELVEHHVDSAFESISLVKKNPPFDSPAILQFLFIFLLQFQLKINLHHCCLSIMQCSHVTAMHSSK